MVLNPGKRNETVLGGARLMAEVTTTFSPFIAEVLTNDKLTHQFIWKHLRKGPLKLTPLSWRSNSFGFDYDPTDDTVTVFITWADPANPEAEATLKTPDFPKELAKYARGASEC